jgi:type IV secretion system protein VirB11
MSALLSSVYLQSFLAPLVPHLSRADVTDLFINRPREIWLECLGGGIERREVSELEPDLLARLARQIAAHTAQGISRENPLLAATLPTGERIQVIIPPATRGEIAIAIRKHVVSDLALEDYQVSDQGVSKVFFGNEKPEVPVSELSTDGVATLLRKAVHQRRNILISGGTSSGKTTLLNVLLSEISADERLILIEDTPELQLKHENAVGLIATRGSMGEAEVNAEDLLIAALRMRPDRIILGEIRGSEATTFLRAINTGHPGSLSTVHADSPVRAIDQIALLVLQTGIRMSWEDVTTYVRRSLDIIIHLKRGEGRRRIDSILFVKSAPLRSVA